MSEFPGDETFEQETGADPETNGYPDSDPLGLEGGPAFEGGEGAELEPDPFAEVPPVAPVEEELPPGVQQGSLGGESPSEMEPIDPESEPPYEGGKDPLDPAPVEPGPGDIADDDPPLGAEDVGLGDEPPLPPVPDEAGDEGDPLAGTEGATGQEDLSALIGGAQDNTQLESEHKTPGEEPDPEPPKPARKPRKKRGKGPKLAPGQREYTILKYWAAPAAGGEEDHGPLWEQALPDPVIARSGELAMRKAFRVLTDNKPGSYKLVPIPTKYWNPEEVEGEVPDAALSIKVGGGRKK